MATETTLGIIKPDAVQAGKAGKILAHLEQSGFVVRALRMTRLDADSAGEFYEVHRERPFYASLVTFMTSGPAVPIVLEADGAVRKLREVIGVPAIGQQPRATSEIWMPVSAKGR